MKRVNGQYAGCSFESLIDGTVQPTGSMVVGPDGDLVYTNKQTNASAKMNFGCYTAADLATLLGVAKVYQVPNGKALKITFGDAGNTPVLLFETMWSGTHAFGIIVQNSINCLGYNAVFPTFNVDNGAMYIGITGKDIYFYIYNCFRTQYDISVVDYSTPFAHTAATISAT